MILSPFASLLLNVVGMEGFAVELPGVASQVETSTLLISRAYRKEAGQREEADAKSRFARRVVDKS